MKRVPDSLWALDMGVSRSCFLHREYRCFRVAWREDLAVEHFEKALCCLLKVYLVLAQGNLSAVWAIPVTEDFDSGEWSFLPVAKDRIPCGDAGEVVPVGDVRSSLRTHGDLLWMKTIIGEEVVFDVVLAGSPHNRDVDAQVDVNLSMSI